MDNNITKQLANELTMIIVKLKRFSSMKNQHAEIRQSEFMILTTLEYHMTDAPGGLKITEISNLLQITPPAVTHIIDPLVKNNYVERLNDQSDRRVVRIQLTEKGLEIVNAMKLKLINKFEDIINYLGEKESRELIRLLKKSIDYLIN